jgi:hypothetical protein
MAEIELNILMGQCLAGRVPDFGEVKKKKTGWGMARVQK